MKIQIVVWLIVTLCSDMVQ